MSTAQSVTWPRVRGTLPVLAVLIILAVGQSPVLASSLEMTMPVFAAACIAVIAAVLWISEAVPLYITSFVLLVLESLWLVPVARIAGVQITATEFSAPFFSDPIILFLGGFTLSIALHKYGLDERLAHRILTRAGGNPSRILLAIIGTTAFLSMWMSNTACTAMMLALVLPVIGRLENGDPFEKALMLGVPFAANIGGIGTPIGTPPNVVAIKSLAEMGSQTGFAYWMVLTLPPMIFLSVTAWLLLIWIYPPRTTEIRVDTGGNRSSSNRGFLVALTCVATALGWLLGESAGLSPGMVAMAPVIFLFGTGLLDADDFRHISWDVLLLVGGGLSLGRCVELSGLGAWIVERIGESGLSGAGIGLAFAGAAAVMTAVMSNTATANLLIPVAASMNFPGKSGTIVAIAMACSLSMPLPVSTPTNAIAFSSGRLTAKEMVIPGLLISLLGVAAVMLLCLPYWRLMGLK